MEDEETKDLVNILIISDSGKPVFVRHGSAEDTARVCGLLQTLKLSAESQLRGGLQSIISGRMCICFMEVKTITLVAISTLREQQHTEAQLKLLLEYCYAALVSTLTDAVMENSDYDLSVLIDENFLRRMLDDWENDPAVFLSSGIRQLTLDPSLRRLASQVLQEAATDQTVYALILVKDKLLTLVQPRKREYLLHGSDLHILMRYVYSRKERELWFPICLPRLFSAGTFQCYTACMEQKTETRLAIVTQDGSTEEFGRLRSVARNILRALGLPATVLTGTSTTIYSSDSKSIETTDNSEDDFVELASNGEEREMVSSRNISGGDMPFLRGLIHATDAYNFKVENYLKLVPDAIHFLFRYDATVGTKEKQLGQVSQSFGPSLDAHDVSIATMVWHQYHQLSVRLRLGSSTSESVSDAFSAISSDIGPNKTSGLSGIASLCPAMVLAEATPSLHTISYVCLNNLIIIATNGQDFELYLTASASTSSVKDVVLHGARLARRILLDRNENFLTKPILFK